MQKLRIGIKFSEKYITVKYDSKSVTTITNLFIFTKKKNKYLDYE